MNSVREAIGNVREEARMIRVSRLDLRIERHWLALIVAMLVVFASFFAIGRMRHPSSAPGGEPPARLQAASVKVAIPTGLQSAPPIEANAALEAIAAANRRASAPPRAPSISIRSGLRAASSPLQSAATETPRSSPSEQSSPASSAEPVHSESPPARAEPAPAPEAPAPSSSPAPSEAGHSGSSAGGGSFDSSG